MSEPIEYTEDEKSELESLRASVITHQSELDSYYSLLTSVETQLKVIKRKIESHEQDLMLYRGIVQNFPNSIRERRKDKADDPKNTEA